MRAKQFLTESQPLYEIGMSPSNLRTLAAATGAIAGMEFEMVVPGVRIPDDDETEFPGDTTIDTLSEIKNFFRSMGANTSTSINRLMNLIEEKYSEWRDGGLSDLWKSEGYDFFEDELRELFDFDEATQSAIKYLGTDDEKTIEKHVENTFLNFAEEEWKHRDSDNYLDIYQKWVDSEAPEPTDSDFLSDHRYRWMSDIYNEYNHIVDWPNQPGGTLDIVANQYSEAIGKPVNVSSVYHRAPRYPGEYSLEPDSSVKGSGPDDTGLEFITPPMPIDELLDDLQKTIKWADEAGAYTNTSTGLHMNISIPGKSINTHLDFIKLALLIGDEYVLKEFGRSANDYTISALSKIQARINANPNLATTMLSQMRDGLHSLATRLVVSQEGFGKYFSINPKEDYVEFRSPGGDWLNEDLNKLTTTLLRFIVALDASLDPNKYRKEYLKKLYQMLQPKSNTDPLAYFAQYSAGLLPKVALKSFIKQIQLTRNTSKNIGNLVKYEIYKISKLTNDVVGTFYAEDDPKQAYEAFYNALSKLERNSGQPMSITMSDRFNYRKARIAK